MVTLSLVIDETLLETIDKMDKAVAHVQSQFQTVRTGRAAPALVERLTVDYYGTQVPIVQLATIQVPEARQLLVRPHDRNTLAAIEKAIRDSDLGVAPGNDGATIRLSFPPLTEERRKEYVKVVKHLAEEGTRRRAQRPARGPQAPRGRREAGRRSRPTSSTEPRRSWRRSPTTTPSRSTLRCTARRRSCSRSDDDLGGVRAGEQGDASMSDDEWTGASAIDATPATWTTVPSSVGRCSPTSPPRRTAEPATDPRRHRPAAAALRARRHRSAAALDGAADGRDP